MLERGQDQAAGLRQLMAGPSLRVLAFPLPGHGPEPWVGQIARGLRSIGRRPVVLDAARGAVTSGLGMPLRHDLLDLLQGDRSFDDVAHATQDGVYALRADRGIEAFVSSGQPASQLLGGFARLTHAFDDLLLAMPADELACLAAPPDTVPVVSVFPGAAGLVHGYGLVKQLAQGFGYRRFACVTRDDTRDAQADGARLAAAAARFLGVDVRLAGRIDGSAHAAGMAAHELLQATSAPGTLH